MIKTLQKRQATSTYIRKETRIITEVFIITDLKIIFKTTNKLQEHLRNPKKLHYKKILIKIVGLIN